MSARFLYHASAIAAGGYVTGAGAEAIEAQAAAVVPSTGGRSSARVDGYELPGLLSFRTALSTIVGSAGGTPDRRVYRTVATVTIEGLDVGRGLLTVDRLVACLASEQAQDGGELPIRPAGSAFTNLRIAGVPLAPRPHDTLLEGGTLDGIAAAGRLLSGAAGPVDIDGNPLALGASLGGRTPAAGGAAGSYEERTILTSIYERPVALPDGCRKVGGWGIAVPGLGTVHLGELFITRFSRRLTMIRMEVESAGSGATESTRSGELVVAEIGGNGSTYP